MKRDKVITFAEYYMDLNAFHESIKTHYFKNKPVYIVVGPEIFIERAFNEFVNKKNAGEL